MTRLTSSIRNVSASAFLVAFLGFAGDLVSPKPAEAQCSACMISFFDGSLTCIDYIVGAEVCAIVAFGTCIEIGECEWIMMLDIAEDGTPHSREDRSLDSRQDEALARTCDGVLLQIPASQSLRSSTSVSSKPFRGARLSLEL